MEEANVPVLCLSQLTINHLSLVGLGLSQYPGLRTKGTEAWAHTLLAEFMGQSSLKITSL